MPGRTPKLPVGPSQPGAGRDRHEQGHFQDAPAAHRQPATKGDVQRATLAALGQHSPRDPAHRTGTRPQRNELRFSIRDDGCGFAPADAPGISQGHYGLQGIRERIDRLGGSLDISSSKGRGTDVTIVMPAKELED